MNRNFANGGKVFAMQAAPVMIAQSTLIGAAGAVTSASNSGNIVSSVQRVGLGIYLLNLREPAYAFMFASGSVQSPAVGLSGISTIEIQNGPQADISEFASPGITIKTLDAAGALANPASGSVINMLILLNNSSVPA